MTDAAGRDGRSPQAHKGEQTRASLLYSDFDVARSRGYGTDWDINGESAEQYVTEFMEGDLSDEGAWGNDFCPYCETLLDDSQFSDIPDPENEEWHYNRLYELKSCRRCAFWEFMSNEGGSGCMDRQTMVFAAAVAKKFEAKLPQECTGEFAQHLRRHPNAWHQVSPKGLEKIVADIFKANYAHCEAIHVGKPGDRGVDVVFVDSAKQKWLIQVKRRKKSRPPEGVETLRSILGTLVVHGERRGIIVTTADYFSHHAQRETQGIKDKGYEVQLVDKGILDRMLSPVLPKHPWRSFLEQPLFEELDDRVRRHFVSDLPDPNQLDLFER